MAPMIRSLAFVPYLFLSFECFSQSADIPRISFPSSSAPVHTVVLSYTRNDDDSGEEGFEFGQHIPNPRLDLIRKVRERFPELEIRLTSELTPSRLFELHPDLETIAHSVVQIPNMTSVQDPVEFGYNSDGQLMILSFGIEPDGPYSQAYPLISLIPEGDLVSVPSTGPTRTEEMQWTARNTRRWAGGNVEFLPDGTPVMGLNAPQDAVLFYAQVSGKTVLQLDTGWNSSGDLDEVFLWTQDPLQKASCILFQLDVKSGAELLTQTNIAEYKTQALKEMREFFEKIGMGEYFDEEEARAEIEDRVQTLLVSLDRIPELQKLIDQEAHKIMTHPSMADCRRVKLPVIYAEDLLNNPEGGSFGMEFNNQINSLVIENQVFTLTSKFPAQQRAIEKVFAENGFDVNSVSSQGFDGGGGNMHCSTNTIRKLE
jgi:hypothetical protein